MTKPYSFLEEINNLIHFPCQESIVVGSRPRDNYSAILSRCPDSERRREARMTSFPWRGGEGGRWGWPQWVSLTVIFNRIQPFWEMTIPETGRRYLKNKIGHTHWDLDNTQTEVWFSWAMEGEGVGGREYLRNTEGPLSGLSECKLDANLWGGRR